LFEAATLFIVDRHPLTCVMTASISNLCAHYMSASACHASTSHSVIAGCMRCIDRSIHRLITLGKIRLIDLVRRRASSEVKEIKKHAANQVINA
jgi:hypothetical protein